MGKKLNVSQTRRNEIKENFSSIKKSELNKDERRYYVLVENGKRSARNNVRFEGRYLGGEILDIARKVADRKGLSLDDYLSQNREAVNSFIEHGFTSHERAIDKTIDSLAAIKRKTVEVDDGNGIVKIPRAEAIERLAKLEQFASSNTTIVAIAPQFKHYKTGKFRIVVPPPEYYEDFSAEEFKEMLDELGIFYVDSPKKGN